jgi:hypothetical protein
MKIVSTPTGEEVFPVFLSEDEALFLQGSPTCDACTHRQALHYLNEWWQDVCLVCVDKDERCDK